MRSPNRDQRPVGADIELIVIHAISLPPNQFGTGCVEQLFTNQLDPDEHDYFRALAGVTVSAHFFIDRLGAVSQFVAVNERAWHAGESCWQERVACNDFSIGIELEGSDDVAFSDAQYASLNDLLTRLRGQWPQLAQAAIVGHSDIAPGRKTDPGPQFQWRRVRHPS